MTGLKSESLSNLLDKVDDEPRDDANGSAVENGNCNGENLDEGAARLLYEEHLARIQAEAQAQDKSRRLTVAQQQLAEYAAQKEEDATGLENEALSLEKLVESTLTQITDAELIDKLKESLGRFREKVSGAADEARAFSAQQKADLERGKRSPEQVLDSQAELPLDGDAEMKKPREATGDEELESEQLEEDDHMSDSDDETDEEEASTSNSSEMLDRCRYIPLRLSYDERNYLRLLEAALNVSEYTDKVDILSWRSKSQRIQTQIKRICAILSGLVVAQDYRKGQQLVQSRSFGDNEAFFQDIFEIGRRYKIMNPDKMRAEYGKLVYMLMDSADEHIQELLEFKCVRPLKSVHCTLEENDGLKMLSDPLINLATAEIVVADKSRPQIQREIKLKEKARDTLAQRYSNRNLSQESILTCLYSIGDNNSFLLYNRDPIDRMIDYLKKYFGPTVNNPGCSLAISMGSQGARLTHNHERQFQYVLQTLTLWREISNDMFKLWCLAENDLLNERNYYRLTDTGQGLNRVQQAPLVRKAVYDIISRCQTKIGHWVGSSVVHLGDHNVPNALMFIDKYTQVPRILNPVVLVLEEIPKLYQDPKMQVYIDKAFGGVDGALQGILLDFFRHAFDGSGADNFFDAGSCIDGRLTSAWNWCSKIEKKPYYHIFKVAGFVGFDGDFQK
ncbi:hypothetical protein BSKO_09837 [Bryopsis sp. KO-2023]|nr:hypothetical protein BSKO_09837 [Bryopsis sp. KO-2023]